MLGMTESRVFLLIVVVLCGFLFYQQRILHSQVCSLRDYLCSSRISTAPDLRPEPRACSIPDQCTPPQSQPATRGECTNYSFMGASDEYEDDSTIEKRYCGS